MGSALERARERWGEADALLGGWRCSPPTEITFPVATADWSGIVSTSPGDDARRFLEGASQTVTPFDITISEYIQELERGFREQRSGRGYSWPELHKVMMDRYRPDPSIYGFGAVELTWEPDDAS